MRFSSTLSQKGSNNLSRLSIKINSYRGLFKQGE